VDDKIITLQIINFLCFGCLRVSGVVAPSAVINNSLTQKDYDNLIIAMFSNKNNSVKSLNFYLNF